MHERNYNNNQSNNATANAEAQQLHRSSATVLPNHQQLFVGAKNDNQETEADSKANQILAGGNASTPSFVQRNEKNNGPVNANSSIVNQINATKNGGVGIDNQTKSFMESRFGASFQNVRIHENTEAATLSEQLNAKAFTVGNNVYFNQGKYAPNTTDGKRLLAHELTHTIQQKEIGTAIQKEDKDKPATAYAPTPEIDFKLLPPDFQLKLFHFLLEANTSTVHLDYNAKSFMAGLSYQYGDALSLNMRFNDFKSKLGWTPGNNNLSLGLNYKGFDAKLTGNFAQQKLGFGLHYGDPLLPMQDQMTSTFNAGGTSFGNLMTGLPGAFHDPIAFYQQNKAEVENVTKTADLVKQITEAGKSKIRFGGDFSLTYDPVNKVVITAKVGLMF